MIPKTGNWFPAFKTSATTDEGRPDRIMPAGSRLYRLACRTAQDCKRRLKNDTPETRTPPRSSRGGAPNQMNNSAYRFTAFLFKPLPAEKRGRFAALILTGAPVRGSRPSRAARFTTLKFPNPIILTSPPFFNVAVMASKVASQRRSPQQSSSFGPYLLPQ